MKILVIVPIFNEAEHLSITLESFAFQTFPNIHWVLVNDSSTDGSKEIIDAFSKRNSNFTAIHLNEAAVHIPGAKIVQTFYKGLDSIELESFDIISKLDADIILPKNYFECIITNLLKNPKIGIIGGLLYIQKNGKWIYENISDKNHIRGPIKIYKKACFEDIGGLRKTLGWDNLDILLAKMEGWETLVLPELKVKHLRPTSFIYKKSKAKKLGEYFYQLGLCPLLAFISCLKASLKEASILSFFSSYSYFLKLFFIIKPKRQISKEEIKFIRKYKWNIIANKIKIRQKF